VTTVVGSRALVQGLGPKALDPLAVALAVLAVLERRPWIQGPGSTSGGYRGSRGSRAVTTAFISRTQRRLPFLEQRIQGHGPRALAPRPYSPLWEHGAWEPGRGEGVPRGAREGPKSAPSEPKGVIAEVKIIRVIQGPGSKALVPRPWIPLD